MAMTFTIENLNDTRSRIVLHFIFWLSYLSFFILQSKFFYVNANLLLSSISLFITLSIDILATYFTVYYLLPKLLFKRKYVLFFILLIISVAIAIILQRVILYYISYPYFYPHLMDRVGDFWRINPFSTFINIYSVVGLFTAIKLIKYWFLNQQMKVELENKNKSSELALLRSQLNPHFLFNTLNNIDSLIMSNQEKASDAIIKLSDILRSVIYESDEIVPLRKEIDYLSNYIDLQKLRLKDPNFVSFEIEGYCENHQIAPMLLIPFVENAFKHGQKNISSPGILIKLNCDKNSFTFEVSNQYNDQILQNKDDGKGIGLANTQRRLELLYPKNHHLEIKKENNLFTIKLQLIKSNDED